MSLEWDVTTIGELCSNVSSGGTPKSTNEEYYGGNIPWLNTKEINFNRIYDTEKHITNEGFKNSAAKWVKKDSVIVAMYGATAAKVAMNMVDLTTNQACCNLTIDKSLANPKFVYYYLYSNYERLLNLASGAAQQNLNSNIIKEFPINIPSLNVQNEIVNLLSTIDDKIELNQKVNKNLQKQINILFKSFFINFEFYDGKYQETLFGEIPIEWNIILFKDILNERNEKSTNQDIPMYSVTLDGIQPRADIYKKKITAKTTKFKIIHKYDLIFGMPNSGYQYGIMYDEIGGVSSAYPVFEINGIQPRYVDLFIKNISNYFNDIVKSGSRMGQGIDKKVLLSKEIYDLLMNI